MLSRRKPIGIGSDLIEKWVKISYTKICDSSLRPCIPAILHPCDPAPLRPYTLHLTFSFFHFAILAFSQSSKCKMAGAGGERVACLLLLLFMLFYLFLLRVAIPVVELGHTLLYLHTMLPSQAMELRDVDQLARRTVGFVAVPDDSSFESDGARHQFGQRADGQFLARSDVDMAVAYLPQGRDGAPSSLGVVAIDRAVRSRTVEDAGVFSMPMMSLKSTLSKR